VVGVNNFQRYPQTASLEAKHANLEHATNCADEKISVVQKHLGMHDSQIKKMVTEIIPSIHAETRSHDSQVKLFG